MSFFVTWIINTIALLIVVHIAPGINVDRWQTAAMAAFVLGLVNVFLKPLIILFTLPLNILSLGLFTFVINGFMLYLVSQFVQGFSIVSFEAAFQGALLFSIISFILNLLLNTKGRFKMQFYGYHPASRKKYRDAIDVTGKVENKKEINRSGDLPGNMQKDKRKRVSA